MNALRASARVAVLIGAVGSVGLTLYAGRQNPSSLLMVAFAIWVLSPFVLIILLDSASPRWPFLSRPALNVATLTVTAISLVAYVARVLRPPKAQAAFVFVVVPPVCWFLIAGAVAGAAWSSRRQSKP
jgi:hypothetical protein